MLNSMCVVCGIKITSTSSSSSTYSSSSSSSSSTFGGVSGGAGGLATACKTTLTISGGQQLQLSEQEAARVQRAKLTGLRDLRKLALVLDLDHTLVHAAPTASQPSAATLAREGLLYLPIEEPSAAGNGSTAHHHNPMHTAITHAHTNNSTNNNNTNNNTTNNNNINSQIKHHVVCKRPHLDSFLQQAHEICQLTIYTAGTRRYAEGVARLLDPSGKLFANRIVSRSDVPNDKSAGR